MNHEISLQTAISLTSRFRQNREGVLDSTYRNQDILPFCETFDKQSVQALLDLQGSASLRIYYGMDEDLKLHAILVAADSTGADILPASSTALDDPGIILEDGLRCPHTCPPESPLNED